MLRNTQSMHMAKPRSESPTSSTACTGMDAPSQRGICKPSSLECSPLLHLAPASAQLASTHLWVSGHTASPLKTPAVSRSVPCPALSQGTSRTLWFSFGCSKLVCKGYVLLRSYSQCLTHCGYLNILAALVGVTPEFPKQYWNCFLEM